MDERKQIHDVFLLSHVIVNKNCLIQWVIMTLVTPSIEYNYEIIVLDSTTVE